MRWLGETDIDYLASWTEYEDMLSPAPLGGIPVTASRPGAYDEQSQPQIPAAVNVNHTAVGVAAARWRRYAPADPPPGTVSDRESAS